MTHKAVIELTPTEFIKFMDCLDQLLASKYMSTSQEIVIAKVYQQIGNSIPEAR